MSTYVLVHGAWHGAWCWDKVVPLLEQAGHTVIAPTLPGHGADNTPTAQVTLAAYTDYMRELLAQQTQPVILVGHSMGGIVITQTAEYVPDKIKKLVYLTGFLPKDGESLLQYAQADQDALVLPNLVMSADQSSATIKDDMLQATFYADCSADDVAQAKQHLVAQALAPLATPVQITAENFGSVPKVYVMCLQDRAISPSTQAKMTENAALEQLVKLDTSHSPFYSAPEAVATELLKLA